MPEIIETLITKDDLDGLWQYSCDIMLPGGVFPLEKVKGDENLFANRHGGEVEFELIDNSNILITGKRRWHEVKGTNNDCFEFLEKPVEWKRVFSMLFAYKALIYQYEILGFEGINGISNVYMNESNKKQMSGWFYYIPSLEYLEKVKGLQNDMNNMTLHKHYAEWLKLFGRIELTKVS